MTDFIEINHIAPLSRYIFEKGDNIKYQLVLISTLNNKPVISVINLNNIDNISETVRGYTVRKIVKTNSIVGMSDSIKLFKLKDNILYLLFSGRLEHDYIEYNSKHIITLSGSPSSNNKLRNTHFINESSYLNEKFFNFDTSTTDKCIISLLKVKRPQSQVVQRKIINNVKRGYLIYDRYSTNIILENIPDHIVRKIDNGNVHNQHINIFKSYYCENSKNYSEFLDDYQIDANMYKKKNPEDRIKLEYRPKRYEPYINNILTAPSDSRISFKDEHNIICRVTPQDYRYIHVPYAARLINITKGTDITTYKFESNYYMPPDVAERDYPALITGNYIHHGVGVGMGSRYQPSLLKIQPDTILRYSLTITGGYIPTNKKLINEKEVNGDSKWFEQGEEIGKYGCRGGIITCIFNRKIDYTSDIKDKTYNTFVKLNDIIGIIN